MLIYTKQKGGQISSLIKILDTPPFLTIGCRGPWRQQCQPLEIKVDLPSKIENIPVGQEWEGSASSYKTQSFYKAKKGVCSFGKSSRKHLTIWPNFGPKAPHLSPGKHLGEVGSWVAGQAWGLAEVQCRVTASQSERWTWWWWRWTAATTCKGRTWRCSARRRPSCSRPSLTRLARITGRWEPGSLLFPAAEGV